MDRHPAADDPNLQVNMDLISNYPDEWALKEQIRKNKEHLEDISRRIRALESDVVRTNQIISTLELSLLNLVQIKKEFFD